MKFNQKNIIMLVLAGIIVVALIMVLSGKKGGEITDFSMSPTPVVTGSPNPTNAPGAQITTSPKPGIIAKEVQDFNYWFDRLDYQNRVLAIYDECNYMVPSNVAYPNNTQVMLDNTRSKQNHVLKIGTKEYSLGAGEWQLVTLSSPKVPVNLPIFCKSIELGQIELD